MAALAPVQAVEYQVVIMFLIASVTAVRTVGVVLLRFLGLFNADHQFLHSRIK